jgi:hypothetical protein
MLDLNIDSNITSIKRHTWYYSISLYLAQVRYTTNLAVPCDSRWLSFLSLFLGMILSNHRSSNKCNIVQYLLNSFNEYHPHTCTNEKKASNTTAIPFQKSSGSTLFFNWTKMNLCTSLIQQLKFENIHTFIW